MDEKRPQSKSNKRKKRRGIKPRLFQTLQIFLWKLQQTEILTPY